MLVSFFYLLTFQGIFVFDEFFQVDAAASRRYTGSGLGLTLVRDLVLLLDGEVVAEAEYGQPAPGITAFWRISTDPRHPDVAFRARVDVGARAAGRYWRGLRLHGEDGSVEDWSEQPVRFE